jgi:hypothetical protein
MNIKFLLLLTAFSLSLFSTKAQETSWSVTADTKVEWLMVNPSGFVVAATKECLYGISPKTKQIAWKFSEVVKADKLKSENIPNSPFFLARSGSQTWIVNVVTGELVFDSQKMGFESVVSRNAMIAKGTLLVEGNVEGLYSVMAIDMANGKELWRTKLADTKPRGGALSPPARPIVDNDGNYLYAFDKSMIRINAQTGAVVWRKDYDGRVRRIYLNAEGTVVYPVAGSMSNILQNEGGEKGSFTSGMSGNTGSFVIAALNLADGSDVWAKPLVLKSKFSGLSPMGENFFLLHTTGANLVSYATGEVKWAKEPKVGADALVNVYPVDNGIVAITNYESGRANIFRVSTDGVAAWQESSATIIDSRLTAKGLFFISQRNPNCIDINTGKLVMLGKSYLAFKGGTVVAFDGVDNAYLAFTDGKLIKINSQTAEWSVLASDISFEGGEMPNALERRADGYFFTSAQSAVLVGLDGVVKYKKYFPAPQLSGAARFALGAASDFSSAAASDMQDVAVAATMVGSQNNSAEMLSLANDYAQASKIASGIAATTYELMNMRFTASGATKDAAFFLTTVDKKTPAFTVIGKSDGNSLKQVVIDSKDPKYDTDTVESLLYVVVDNTTIKCEAL